MKSLVKILSRYLASATGVALILLMLNILAFGYWLVIECRAYVTEFPISEVADELSIQNGNFVLSEEGNKAITKRYKWAMLLDDHGSVIWSKNLPDDLPRTYTVPEVASFTRWYLQDYPVYVWRHPQGLLVLGSAKGSLWKMRLEMPQVLMNTALSWIPGVLILNIIAVVVLALLMGLRLFRSLRTMIKGIDDLANQQPVNLPTSGVLSDIAEKLNQTSLFLRNQQAALKKRDNARTTWIAGVSHDIRTPLSMVMGYASELEENPVLAQAERNQVKIIRQQSEKIKGLISNLNLASKLEYNMQPLQIKIIYPSVMLRELIADFVNNELDERYTIDLQVESGMEKVKVVGDDGLLRRAIINLLENSIRYNPDGCAITVKFLKDFPHCAISVTDNGKGFSCELLEILQNPVDPTVLRNHGLGLIIVRQIIEAHEGTVHFSSLAGKGCSVVLQLPIKENYEYHPD
jgi:signal transduction histidine kinase